MIFRSLFAFTLIITLFIHTINAINPAYLQERLHEELVDTNSNVIDDERPGYIIKRNNDDEDDEEDYLIKRNKYTNFYLSPLWLSRRTRTNRMYGKPLWISRTG
jgi:hypothetical protein